MRIAPALQQELERLARVEARNRRDRIATAALQGLLAYPGDPPFPREVVFQGVAKVAVQYADALIAELDKEGAP